MIRRFADLKLASNTAVNHIMDLTISEVRDKGFCTIVLAGGSTPQLTYELLSLPDNARQMPWQQCHFFWGDERWVASTHPASNFNLADQYLLSKVPVPSRNIHRMTTEHMNPSVGAENYEKHLRDFFQTRLPAAMNSNGSEIPIPSFDLILLGMGEDGHTASLFPGSPLLEEKKKWVVPVPAGAGSPPVARISLTLPVLNGAQNVLFLIAGNKKMKILDDILAESKKAEHLYPAARVKPVGNLVWLAAEKE